MQVTKQILEKIERYKKFYKSDKGGLMVLTSYPIQTGIALTVDTEVVEVTPLDKVDWQDEMSIRSYAKGCIEEFKRSIKHMSLIEDDSIPTIQVLAGTGMIGATFVKNPILTHEKDTNYLEVPIKNWEDGIDNICFNPNNQYYKAQMIILRSFIKEWDGSFSILPFTHFDPLDLCNQFRGNDIFYDFYEEPENLHKLLEKATNAIIELEDYTRKHFMDGYNLEGTGMWCWLPGGNYLSCDIGDMSSPEIIREFDRPYFDRIVEHWGGAFLHHHELGIHQIDTWAESKKLTVQFLNRDPNTRHLAETMDDKIIEASLKLPINFIATYKEFSENAEKWAEGKFIVFVDCNNEEEVKEVIRRTEKLRNC